MKWRIIAACGLVALAAFGFGCAAQTGVAPSGDTKVADEEQTKALLKNKVTGIAYETSDSMMEASRV